MTLIDEIQHDMEQHPLDRNPAVMARALELIEQDEALLRQALEALEDMRGMLRWYCYAEYHNQVIDALKERLKP